MISRLFKMKRGTKVGWLLVAFAVLLSLWVIIGQSAKANTTTPEGLVLNDAMDTVIGYEGAGGDIPAAYFPSTVTTIASRAFAGQTTITSIELPSNVLAIGTESFSGCENLTNIAFSTTQISTIPDSAFANCNNLASVSLPATVGTIGPNAFLNCGSLQSCDIPANATFDPIAFKGCSSLAAYRISGGSSSNYMVYGGNIYDTTGVRLLRVAPGISTLSSVELYGACKEIGTGAFSANQWITEFNVPDSISRIQQNAFSNSSIKKLTVSSENTQVESQANWSALSEVYGIADSSAEIFAASHNDGTGVIFYPIGGNTTNNDEEEEEEPAEETPATEEQQPATNTATNTAPQTVINNNNTVTNGGSSQKATSNGKDVTPKTADGDFDIRWLAIIGAFLGGLAIIFYSRTRKLEYISTKKETDLDS